MSEEYQRLQDVAKDVEREIDDLDHNYGVSSAGVLAAIEIRLDILAAKRSSLIKGMILRRSVNTPRFQQKENEFVRPLPHKHHSQRSRRMVVHLSGGVTVTFGITDYHRQKKPVEGFAKARTRSVSGSHAAEYFERSDTACSSACG